MTANGSFGNLQRGGYVYVDKTAYLHSLVRQEGNMFFLSRPRRFGKTLAISTLEAIFQGKRDLFKGLAIDQAGYDWETYLAIHIDFGKCDEQTPEGLEAWLCEGARRNHVEVMEIKEKRYADKFRLEKGKTTHLLGIAFSSTGHTIQERKEELLA